MVIHLEPDVYLKFDNYNYIEKYNNIKFKDNSFYLNIDLLSEKDILILSDFYDVVYNEKMDNYKEIKS